MLKTIKDNDIDLEYLYAFTHNKTDKAILLLTIKDNDIDLEYLYAFTHNKTDKAILLLHTDELDNLAAVLKENNITVVSSEEVYNL